MNDKQADEFDKLAKPLIAWLNENATPHSIIVIEPDGAVVYSGELAICTAEFIKD